MRNKPSPSSLVNTSLPAKEAPKLVPATLASITSSSDVASVAPAVSTASITKSMNTMTLEKVSIYKGNDKKVSITNDAEFPTLGGKPKVEKAVQDKPVMNFAAMSRGWAEKQKEDARIVAEEAEKERMRLQLERMMKEKEEQEQTKYKKTLISLASIKKTKEDAVDLNKDYNNDVDVEDELYESPQDEEYEEEEEEEEYNSQWDGRRYRDEF